MAEELIHLRGESGTVRPHKLPLPAGIADRLAKGHLTQVNADGSPLEGVSPPERPANNAPKAAWVGYAVRAHGAIPDEAEAMTRHDLIDKYGK